MSDEEKTEAELIRAEQKRQHEILHYQRQRDGAIARFYLYQNRAINLNVNRIDQVEVDLLLEKVNEIERKLESTFLSIHSLCTTSEWSAEKSDFESAISAVTNTKLLLRRLKPAPEVINNNSSFSSSFKIQQVKLPTFNGDLCDWQSFRDLFVTAVHNNSSLSDVEKITHLKSCLVGPAAKLINSYTLSAANYSEAWKAVQERYENIHEIIRAHIMNLDNCKALSVESATGLRSLSDALSECVRSLRAIEVQVSDEDIFPIYLIVKKMDPETQKQWSLIQTKNLPKISQLTEFLESRARALISATSSSSSSSSSSSKGSHHEKKKSHHTSSNVKSSQSCVQCKEAHYLGSCKEFQNLQVQKRKQLVINNNLCFNCLSKGHGVSTCSSKSTCRKCNGKHHTFLHNDSYVKPNSSNSSNANSKSSASTSKLEENSSESSSASSHCTRKPASTKIPLLGTVSTFAYDSAGRKQLVRVFLDQGSESSFISEHCVNSLGLKRKRSCVIFTGVGDTPGQTTKGKVELNLYSRINNYFIKISALILPKVTNAMPSTTFNPTWSHLNSIQLGDPMFNIPGKIDILLGVKYHVPVLLPEIIYGPEGAPHAQNTQFGWMLSGEVSTTSLQSSVSTHHVSCKHSEECLEDSLTKFWNLEEPEFHSVLPTGEEMLCEENYSTTHQRNADGSYTVQLPFKKNAPALGNSRAAAVKRFLKVESRLQQNPDVKKQYVNQMNEYLHLGFMEKVPDTDLLKPEDQTYYMPHREVIKLSSTTTKCRIVYDASAKSLTGLSLNDILYTGPKLQVDLVPLLIRFRSHQVAMSADIVKFYPQYRVSQQHVDFQRLVWRESPDLPIEDYRMLRVTFGVTCAPFLAIRSLHQLAEDEKELYPHASSTLKTDFLVDNLLSGSEDIQSALVLQQELMQICQKGKLQLTKWTSNSEEVLSAVSAEERECSLPMPIDENETIKTIGILWQPTSDSFKISISTPVHLNATKRKVLSSVAKIFDPLGWLAPVTVKPKILIQQMWKQKLSWDEPLPCHLQNIWSSYCQDLVKLKEFNIPRSIFMPNHTNSLSRFELHGFCDASQDCYSACVYAKSVSKSNEVFINLIAAKTKVAPVKKETIPRLELCSAVLLVKLMKSVQNSIRTDFHIIRCWTDSEIVLAWLNSKKSLKVFEANRVRKILNSYPVIHWSHVNGTENPADPASRGISASKLLHHPIWLRGPDWLATTTFEAVSSHAVQEKEENPLISIINSCSSFLKLKRIIAYVLRYIKNLKLKLKERILTTLSTSELNQALIVIVKVVQEFSFSKEISNLHSQLPVTSNVKFLSPFLDANGIVRVGGRIQHSSTTTYDKKHPILLPAHHHFTSIVVRYYHILNLHAGPNLLLAVLREYFWIVHGPTIVKQIIRKCVTCHKYNAHMQHQIMGELPASRVNPSRPFSNCGVDYAGPFILCYKKGRKPTYFKSYVCVFVCMCVKAVHLEWVSDLTTEAYIAALNRFVSRRGLPADMYSDGGTNFIGAKNEIQEVMKFLSSENFHKDIGDFSSNKGINFHVNPPAAPHHGGLWEAAVKSMKNHLKRVTQEKKLTIEEFVTLLSQIEACMNSRPLTQMSSDPRDFDVLTPGHFLVGSSLHAVPQVDVTDVQTNRLSRWQMVQAMFQHFWKRWSSEYLVLLQSRPKWVQSLPNLEEGVLVLVRDSECSWGPLQWKLGRISSIHPGPDGKVRVCDVVTSSGAVYRRPVTKLSPLPIY